MQLTTTNPGGTLAMAKTHTVGTLTLTFETAAPSLAGTGTLYAVAQARVVDEGHIRYQCGPSEWTYTATSDITTWLAAQPAPWGSKAGTGAKYTPVLIRPEGKNGLRVQAPGTPGLNRDWGAEWIHAGPCPGVAGVIIQAAAPNDDTAGVLTMGAAPVEPDDEDDDATDDKDDDN